MNLFETKKTGKKAAALSGFDSFYNKTVKLVEPGHIYFHEDGRVFKSVSHFIGLFKSDFDRDGMSTGTARKRLKEKLQREPTFEEIQAEKVVVLAEWDFKATRSQDHGTGIHKFLEDYGNGVKLTSKKELELCKKIYSLSEGCHERHLEKTVYLDEIEVAGTSDKFILRNNSRKPIVDIRDYKTNLEKGIEFYSKYGNRMKGPLSHLECCNYNHYTLQMSIYLYFVEKTYGFIPGNLALYFIDPNYELTVIPCAYMRHEVEAMIEYYKEKYYIHSSLKNSIIVNDNDDDVDASNLFN
jgi:hypothetical protein